MVNRTFCFAWILIVSSAIGAPAAGPQGSPRDPWQAAVPDQVGMDSAWLTKARDYALTGGGSGMIVRHDRVVMQWGDQQQTYDLKSSTKAIGVTAAGLALMDGKFLRACTSRPRGSTRPSASRPRAHGRWKDSQIIPSYFIDAVRTVPYEVRNLPVVKPDEYGNASDHYGLLWWNNADGTMKDVPRDAYWSWGLYDSLILVIPSLDIVAARAGKSLSTTRDAHYSPIEPFLTAIAMSVQVPSRWPGAPYPPSEVIQAVEWSPPDAVLRKADGSDNWPSSYKPRLYPCHESSRSL
jgi:hypothetical protein